MQIKENVSLKPYNTFGIEAKTRFLAEVKSVDDFLQLMQDERYKKPQKLFLGGGSNVLFTQNFDGIVIVNEIKGIEKLKEDDEHVWIKANGGEIWHDVVLYCLEHNLAGIENLSLIPGKVGAAPMQNIGAYGVELKNVFDYLEAVHIETGQMKTFDNASCQFGYRESIFKKELKGQYFITAVVLRLNKTPEFNVSYGAIQKTLEANNVQTLSIQEVSKAVCQIRQSKLPDPTKIGNAGSFFKNPVIKKKQFENLKKSFPDIVGYPVDDRFVKVAAGWLIENCGWKGKKVGNTGSHKDQALVLVNYGNATGKEIRELAKAIQESVWQKFEIKISPEVNII